MALVDENGSEWYEVLQTPTNVDPWVAANVIPKLNKAPISEKAMKKSLAEWLSSYTSIHIIADWPEDIAHFCNFLITGPGFRLDTPLLTMEIDRTLNAYSDNPHNALADARAMRLAHQGRAA